MHVDLFMEFASPPAGLYRCEPAPYERASLIAHRLKQTKPRSKILILDPKEEFAQQALFVDGWQKLYPGMIEWVPLSGDGKVTLVDSQAMTLEAVADNLFHPDPYYQQGGDMVRAGNLAYTIDVSKKIGSRISDMTLIGTGEKIDAGKTYIVSGWASVNEGTRGPPVHDLVGRYIERHKSVRIPENRQVKVLGA